MSKRGNLIAIYDFEIFPFALGDVLTWNVRTAMRCEEHGRDAVDAYVCVKEGGVGNVHQRGMVNPQNFDLLFNELYTAFGTSPMLGNIFIYRRREDMIERLSEVAQGDSVNGEAVSDYLGVVRYRVVEDGGRSLARRAFRRVHRQPRLRAFISRFVPDRVQQGIRKAVVAAAFLPEYDVVNQFFTKYVVSHERINEFARRHGRIPLLRAGLGCGPDVDELIERRLAGRRIVAFHMRMRRLDAGYGGESSYARDSNFVEWYDFLEKASRCHPDVVFVALGRLQEKPLQLLRLPNVMSLRLLGMGLGHELSLMQRAHLFIGTSSGFAAYANFSKVPYYITQMTAEAAQVYAIPEGSDRLPFAHERQMLVYEAESSAMLMRLLEDGLGLKALRAEPAVDAKLETGAPLELGSWINAHLSARSSAATISRFHVDDDYRDQETAFLVLVAASNARDELLAGHLDRARALLGRIQAVFPAICARLPQVAALVAIARRDAVDEAGRRDASAIEIDVSSFSGRHLDGSREVRDGWRPQACLITTTKASGLSGERPPSWAIQSDGGNSYLHTERFECARPDGRLVMRFDAKSTVEPSSHRIHIFEDGRYYSIGEFRSSNEWSTFNIPMTVSPASVLELQIDQTQATQQLLIRDLCVEGGAPLSLLESASVRLPAVAWGVSGDTAGGFDAANRLDREARVAAEGAYAQSPPLPGPGQDGILMRFEARVERAGGSLVAVHLFEGSSYRMVACLDIGTGWRRFELLVNPARSMPSKIQLDCPAGAGGLWLRGCVAAPVVRRRLPAASVASEASAIVG